MATTNDPGTRQPWLKGQRPWSRRDGLFRFTINQYHKLDEPGFFEDRHVELSRGIIHEGTINPDHASCSRLANQRLQQIFGVGWDVRPALPLDLGRRSLLEPDLAVVRGSIRDYFHSHPTMAALVVEISNTTLRKVRIIKAHLYDHAGLPEYWIVNLVDRQLEVYRQLGTDPSRPGRFHYGEVTIVPESGTMAPLAVPQNPIAVTDLLP